ncbi:MAG: hypothetical protein IT372_12460 [Polyangiaceae bacterium]|nr:hypothetical protein [Polyangiaceae bacterium]
MMRGWTRAFLFGGLAAALGVLPCLAGCAVSPVDDREETGEVSADLDIETDGDDPGDVGAEHPGESTDSQDEGPDPVPWRPGSAQAAVSGAPVPEPEASGEPDPIPWTFHGDDEMKAGGPSTSKP